MNRIDGKEIITALNSLINKKHINNPHTDDPDISARKRSSTVNRHGSMKWWAASFLHPQT